MTRTRKADLVGARMLSPSVRSLHSGWPTPGPSATSRASTSTSSSPRAGPLVPAGPTPSRRRRTHAPDVFEMAVTRVEGGPRTSEALHRSPPASVVEVEGVRGTFVRTKTTAPSVAVRRRRHRDSPRFAPCSPKRSCGRRGPRSSFSSGAGRPQTCSGETSWPAGSAPAALPTPRHPVRPPPGVGRAHRLRPAHAGTLAEPARAAGLRCGLSAMVDDVVARLGRDEGMPRAALRYETYD